MRKATGNQIISEEYKNLVSGLLSSKLVEEDLEIEVNRNIKDISRLSMNRKNLEFVQMHFALGSFPNCYKIDHSKF